MKRIVVLVSGGGTNLQALLDAQDRGEIPGGQITCVIASKPGVYALERAAAHGIPGKVLERKAYPDVHAYSAAMRDLLLAEQALIAGKSHAFPLRQRPGLRLAGNFA